MGVRFVGLPNEKLCTFLILFIRTLDLLNKKIDRWGKRYDPTRRWVARCDKIRCEATCDTRCYVTHQRCDATEKRWDVRFDRDALCCETRQTRVRLRWDVIPSSLRPCGQDEMRCADYYLAPMSSRRDEIHCLLPWDHVVKMRWDTLTVCSFVSQDVMTWKVFYLDPVWSRYVTSLTTTRVHLLQYPPCPYSLSVGEFYLHRFNPLFLIRRTGFFPYRFTVFLLFIMNQ